MNARKALITVFIIIVVALSLILLACNARETVTSIDGFVVPDDSKAALVLSTGPYEKEKTIIYYYDNNGEAIGKETFPRASCRNAIEENENHLYNFFTHEEIYFSDGKTVENEEIKDAYSFSSDDGQDEVYKSGYMEAWQMFYKNIPHGLAYKIEELGHFDLLTIYNDQEVSNIRINESATIAESPEEEAIYTFSEDNTDSIIFEKIVYDGKNFQKKSGKIDISMAKPAPVWCITDAAWLNGRLYILTSQGEGEADVEEMYIFQRVNNEIVFTESKRFEPKSFGLDKSYSIPQSTVSAQSDGAIKYFPNYAEQNYSGIISFDTEKNEFYFTKYPKREDIDSYITEIRGEVYLLEYTYTDKDDNLTISVIKNDEPTEIMTIKEPKQDMFLVDFYVF